MSIRMSDLSDVPTEELEAELAERRRPKWNDPHFPEGTAEAVIFEHLGAVHGDRKPWGNAFIDDFGQEYPPRVVGVHSWCHRADGDNEQGVRPNES